MQAVGKAKKFTEIPDWQHGESTFDVITDYFLPTVDDLEISLGDSAILALTWFSRYPLARQLRDYGVSIVGPGALPYRRNRDFAPLAEQICGYLMEPRPHHIVAIERTPFNTLLDITGRAHFDIFSYDGRVIVFRLLAEAQKLQGVHMEAIAWLEAAAGAFSQILVDGGYLGKDDQDVFSMSVKEMAADMNKNKIDLANLTISDLSIYATPDSALKLSTLHNAKGREYDAVAVIDLHEGRIPSYYAKTTDEIEEQKRLFYVGLTRAKRYLLYVTDDSGLARNGPSRFLRAEDGVGVC